MENSELFFAPLLFDLIRYSCNISYYRSRFIGSRTWIIETDNRLNVRDDDLTSAKAKRAKIAKAIQDIMAKVLDRL